MREGARANGVLRICLQNSGRMSDRQGSQNCHMGSRSACVENHARFRKQVNHRHNPHRSRPMSTSLEHKHRTHHSIHHLFPALTSCVCLIWLTLRRCITLQSCVAPQLAVHRLLHGGPTRRGASCQVFRGASFAHSPQCIALPSRLQVRMTIPIQASATRTRSLMRHGLSAPTPR